jgi:ATP-binding cassette subfamily B protein
MKDNTKKTLKTYWQFVWKHKVSGFFIMASVVGASFLAVVIPLYFKKFFDVLVSGQGQDIIAKGLISILIIIAGLEFLEWILWRMSGFISSYFQTRILADLANHCFAYLHKHSFAYFTSNFVGSLVKRVKWFVNAFEDIMDRVTWDLLPLVVNVFIITLVLFKVNIWLGLGVIIWTMFFLAVNWIFTKYKLKQ